MGGGPCVNVYLWTGATMFCHVVNNFVRMNRNCLSLCTNTIYHGQFIAHVRALCFFLVISCDFAEAGSDKPCQLWHTCGRHLGLARHLLLVTNNYFEAMGSGLALCRTKDYYWT